jgi:ComF family protein
MRARLASWLFGGSCFLCRGAASAVLCAQCEAELPRLAPPRCPRCALASPRGETCGRCLADAPHFDATVAALEYAFPADALVHALKFRGELALAPLLSGLLAEKIQSKVDLVIPVPLSRERMKERGFNQALEIARHLAPKVEIDLCRRVRDTAAQMDLPFDDRRRNIRGAFSCSSNLDGLSLAVVDDVMTTGATLDEMARTLKRAGAASVVNWVLARTPAG